MYKRQVLDAQDNVYAPSCITHANQPTICSLIKIAPSGTVSTLHTFPKSATLLGLTNDANGNFYSTLENGGAGQNPAFTIYKTTPKMCIRDRVVTGLEPAQVCVSKILLLSCRE